MNTTVSDPDSATFYLYAYNPADPIGTQIGSAIGTVTVANIISAGTFEAYISGEDIYQYNLISSLSSISLSANTDYAIVMTHFGRQPGCWVGGSPIWKRAAITANLTP